MSYVNSYIASFPAISLNLITFLPSTKYFLIFWKFASDHAFGDTATTFPFISYSFTKKLSCNVKLILLKYGSFPIEFSFTIISGAVLS